MPVDIVAPSPGESVKEGVVLRVVKPTGSMVRADELLVELETDKAATEVYAPTAGVVALNVTVGQTIPLPSVIGQIDPAGKPTTTGTAPAKDSSPEAPKAPVPAATDGNVRSSPAARQIAADEGIDLRQVRGSGREGTVIKEDVLAQLTQRGAPPMTEPQAAPLPPPPPAAPTGGETRQRMTPIRARIAQRLLEAQQNAAILTTFNEADLSAVTALRTRYKDAFQKKHGVGLGFMSFFVKAALEALRAFPAVNARIDGEDVVFQHYYHIGVAVSTEKGLMVPVLRDADRLSFAGIEKGIAGLAQKAREGKISVNDLQGGTFTITNGGIFGSLLSTPILNPPQSGILGMHAIQKRPVVVDDQVVIRPMMYLAFSYDHRLIDGRDAVGFLVRVKECVESPDRMMLDI
jgi:2-oxoglutarate dehydrogenase E2 component (dihydrolipoamide succinyltransferase)